MQSIIISLFKVLLLSIVLLTLTKLSTARPQPSIDSQLTSDQENMPELQKSAYEIYSNYNNGLYSPQDLEALRYQLIANWANSRGDQLYRSPEMKRQIRYRQCYFNPISCFRK